MPHLRTLFALFHPYSIFAISNAIVNVNVNPSPSLLYASIVASMRSISVFTIDISRPIPLYTLRTSVFYPYFFHASIIHDSPYLYNHFFSFCQLFYISGNQKGAEISLNSFISLHILLISQLR